MGAPTGQVQCMICHCHPGCELPERDGEPLQRCLVFMLSGWGGGCEVVQCSRPVLSTEESFLAVFTTSFFLISRAVSD